MRYKKDFKNLISLSSIQISNAFLPLVIYPYILKTIGADNYAKVTVSEAISLIVLAFVIYSFEINGVSKVAGLDLKKDTKKISYIFSNIFFSRLGIFIFCLIITFLLAPFLEKELLLLLLCWMLVPLSYLIQSLWLFQALEKNESAAIFTLLSRLLSLGLIIFIIKVPSDFYLVPLIIGLCNLLGSLLSLFFILIKFKIKFFPVSITTIKYFFSNGKHIFLGNMSVTLYKGCNVIILSLINSSPVAIATYSMAEKLIKSLQATTRPLNQLFFPKVIRLIKNFNSPDIKVCKDIFKLIIPQIIVLLVLSIIVVFGYIFLNKYSAILKNFPDKDEIAYLFLIMVPSVFFGICNFMFGSAGLNYLNEEKYLFRSIFAVGIFSAVICVILSSVLSNIGAAISFTVSEFILLILILKRYNYNADGKIRISSQFNIPVKIK